MFQSEPIVCSSSSADNQSRRTIHSSMLYSPSRHESDMGDEEVEYSPTSSGPGGDTGGEVDYSPTHSVSRSWAENEVEASPRTTTHEPPTALNFHTCSVAENEPPPPTARYTRTTHHKYTWVRIGVDIAGSHQHKKGASRIPPQAEPAEPSSQSRGASVGANRGDGVWFLDRLPGTITPTEKRFRCVFRIGPIWV